MSFLNEVIDLTDSFNSSLQRNVVIDLTPMTPEDTDYSIAYYINNYNNLESEKETTKKKLKKSSTSQTKVGLKEHQLTKTENNNKDKSVRWGDCPICWDELGKNSVASTKCGHVYCMRCLERSLEVEKKCPTCRRVLKGCNAYHPLYLN